MRRPNVFASGALDRAHLLRRDNDGLAAARADPRARVALVWRSKSLVLQVGESGEPRPALLAVTQLENLIAEVEGNAPLVLLGLLDGAPTFTLDLSDLDQPTDHRALSGAGEFVDLRQVGALLRDDDGALLAYARAITSWHQRHRFCSVCGHPTASRDGGHLRVCVRDGCAAECFPRTDPAVIMVVHSDPAASRDRRADRCLLGRQASWPEGVFSALAGFVEPGESLENAVVREVFEETGVRVHDAAYHSSQPWPFPSSIMLGFFATADPGEVQVDHSELDQARWFERDELGGLLAARTVRLPPRLSIARRLIDDWLEGEPA